MAVQLTGHNVSVSFDLLPEGTVFYCKSVTPPSYEAGEPIDVTTNATTGLKAYVSPDLAEPGEMSFTAAYDPALDATVKGIIGKKGTTTLTFGKCNNRSEELSMTFDDTYIKSYAPQALSTGSMPEVQITIGFPGGTYNGDTGGEA